MILHITCLTYNYFCNFVSCSKYVTGVQKKVSPQIQNMKCFSPKVNGRECKKISLVKVIDLSVIHLLKWSNLTKNILESIQRLTASHWPLVSKKHFKAWFEVILFFWKPLVHFYLEICQVFNSELVSNSFLEYFLLKLIISAGLGPLGLSLLPKTITFTPWE